MKVLIAGDYSPVGRCETLIRNTDYEKMLMHSNGQVLTVSHWRTIIFEIMVTRQSTNQLKPLKEIILIL